MDFTKVLNAAASVATVTSVIVGSGSSLTASSTAIDGTKRQVHFDVTAASTGDRLMVVTITTTDGQTIVGEGHLEIT